MTRPPARKVTEVAVGVVFRADGAVLLADRPPGKPYPGYWEFPGGKVEPGESIAAALVRELHEELGISVAASTPWVTFEFDYPHAYVRLHFERVHDWSGSPHSREGQRLGFFLPDTTLPTPLLPAAVPALRWLLLPDVLELSNGGWRKGPVLSVEELRATQARPRGEWVGTFAEGRADLERAAKLECDFALVGPIFRATGRSGPGALGWPGFADVARGTPLPVFAFGGIAASDLEQARQHGAHGVAQSASAV
jgi:8-oxo-dGTP diphosphatase